MGTAFGDPKFNAAVLPVYRGKNKSNVGFLRDSTHPPHPIRIRRAAQSLHSHAGGSGSGEFCRSLDLADFSSFFVLFFTFCQLFVTRYREKIASHPPTPTEIHQHEAQTMGYKGEKSASGKTSRRLRTEDKYDPFCQNTGRARFYFCEW